jgi:hypothetical protein
MDPASDLVLALRTLTGDVGATDSLELFVLNTKEFVLRNEGEVFQHFLLVFTFIGGYLGFIFSLNKMYDLVPQHLGHI